MCAYKVPLQFIAMSCAADHSITSGGLITKDSDTAGTVALQYSALQSRRNGIHVWICAYVICTWRELVLRGVPVPDTSQCFENAPKTPNLHTSAVGHVKRRGISKNTWYLSLFWETSARSLAVLYNPHNLFYYFTRSWLNFTITLFNVSCNDSYKWQRLRLKKPLVADSATAQ